MRSAWFLAAAVLSPLIACDNAYAGNGVVKIGILNDQSGVFADSTGTGSTDAARMAAEDSAARQPACRLLSSLRIARTAGHWRRHGQEMVRSRRRRRHRRPRQFCRCPGRQRNCPREDKTILVSAGGTTTLTGSACSPNTVQWTYDTWSQSSAIGTALVKAGNRKWFFLTADYTFGYNLRDETSKVVLANGGEIRLSASSDQQL